MVNDGFPFGKKGTAQLTRRFCTVCGVDRYGYIDTKRARCIPYRHRVGKKRTLVAVSFSSKFRSCLCLPEPVLAKDRVSWERIRRKKYDLVRTTGVDKRYRLRLPKQIYAVFPYVCLEPVSLNAAFHYIVVNDTNSRARFGFKTNAHLCNRDGAVLHKHVPV